MTRAVVRSALCAWRSPSPAAAQVARVSVSTTASRRMAPAAPPSISANGRYVVFSSSATNLVADDTNGVAGHLPA